MFVFEKMPVATLKGSQKLVFQLLILRCELFIFAGGYLDVFTGTLSLIFWAMTTISSGILILSLGVMMTSLKCFLSILMCGVMFFMMCPPMFCVGRDFSLSYSKMIPGDSLRIMVS